jgi:ATP-dependent Lon protease
MVDCLTSSCVSKENKKDLKDIPATVLKETEIILVEHMDEVLREALILKEGEELFTPEEQCEPFCIKDSIPQAEQAPAPVLTAH